MWPWSRRTSCPVSTSQVLTYPSSSSSPPAAICRPSGEKATAATRGLSPKSECRQAAGDHVSIDQSRTLPSDAGLSTNRSPTASKATASKGAPAAKVCSARPQRNFKPTPFPVAQPRRALLEKLVNFAEGVLLDLCRGQADLGDVAGVFLFTFGEFRLWRAAPRLPWFYALRDLWLCRDVALDLGLGFLLFGNLGFVLGDAIQVAHPDQSAGDNEQHRRRQPGLTMRLAFFNRC